MKKVYLLGAMLLGASTTLVSCVDTNESASVEAVRNSKAEEQKALAALYNAQAAAATAQAQAEAALKQAQAALVQAQAEQAKAQAEYQKIMNEYQKDMNNLDLEIKLAQAEQAKAQAEQAIQDIKNQMELAVINQQRAIANAQMQLKDALNQLAAKDAEEFQFYSNQYVNALNEVYSLENQLANIKVSLENYKLQNNPDVQLANDAKSLNNYIASLEKTNKQYQKQIDDQKAELAGYQTQLDYLMGCEECELGDPDALYAKYANLCHEYNHQSEAYNKNHGDKLSKLQEAFDNEKNALWSDEGQKSMDAIQEAFNAIQRDPYYNFVKNGYVQIEVEDGITWGWGLEAWSYQTKIKTTNGDYKWVGDEVVSTKEYVDNNTGKTVTVSVRLCDDWLNDRYLNIPYFAGRYNNIDIDFSAEFDYEQGMSKDMMDLRIANQKKSYNYNIDWYAKRAALFAKNAEEYNKRAKQLKNAAELDSVKIDNKYYKDTIELQSKYIAELGADSIYFVNTHNPYPTEYSYDDLTADWGSVYQMLQNAQAELENEKWSKDSKLSTERSLAAFELYLDMLNNGEKYYAAYEEKVDAYLKLAVAFVKPDADAALEIVALENSDEELVALNKLREERDAMYNAYIAVSNHLNAIENVQSNINWVNNNIENYEGWIADNNDAIESAKAQGVVNAEVLKNNYNNMVASYEADIKVIEEQIPLRQKVVDMLKAILDQLVASEAE